MPIHGYQGNVISGTPPSVSPTSASGVWTLDDQLQNAANWPSQSNIARSLRFNSADSAYLNRTPSVAGDRQKFTWSGWIKRSKLGLDGPRMFVAGSGSDIFIGRFLTSDAFQIVFFNGTNYGFSTVQVFRDVSSWYHFVIAVDTTQATDTNRFKLYVNGSQVTNTTSLGALVPQNTNLPVNNTVAHSMGIGGGNYFDGYLADVYLIDGQALTPSSFGYTDSNGIWQPNSYTGSYGTNGFWLNFDDNSNTTATTLGKDSSGNGNNWTPNNFSVTAGAGNDSLVDSPTNYGTDTGVGGEVRGNYATFNSINSKLGAGSLTNGNLTFTGPSGTAAYNFTGGTFEIDTSTITGWYFEITQSTYGQFAGVSLLDTSFFAGALDTANSIGAPGGNATAGITYRNTGNIYNYGTETTGLTTWSSSGDVIGIAIKDNKIWFAKNNTWISGNPAAGTSPSITLSSTKKVTPAATGINSNVFDLNAGQRPFAYTAPAGFKALCSTNLPTPTILSGDDYFNTVLYTGTTSSPRTITGVGFQPDFVWVKNRSDAYGNYVWDVVRGTDKDLRTDGTFSEADVSAAENGIISTNASDGFTVKNGGTSGLNVGSSGTNSYVAWNWKANGAGSSNTAGSRTSTVSVNQTAGFSVVTYTGTGGGATTVGHGLGVAPSMMILKFRNTTSNWSVYHTSLGNTKRLTLNTTDAESIGATFWNNTSPTSSIFTVGSDFNQGFDYVVYCFAAVPGYSAFGSYTGNGSTDGPFVYTGFRPAFVMLKLSNGTSDWYILDNKRSGFNVGNDALYPNASYAENSGLTYPYLDLTSNGFKIRSSSYNNSSGFTYIYAAFAENPFKIARAR